MTMDPVYVKNQSKISKFLIDNDRGDYVGNAGRYRSLFENLFFETNEYIVNDMLVYPYDFYITRSIKKEG